MSVTALSTAGMTVKYAVETTAGTRPSTGYTEIPGVKAIPAVGSDVNTIQTTPLSATKNHTYIKGLADSGGSIQLTVNDYDAFRTAYKAAVTASETAASSGKATWLEFAYPSSSSMDSFYIPVELVELGFGGAEVDSVLENSINAIPQGQFVFATASTSG